MARIPPQGWHVEITHPTSGRTLQPDVRDEDVTILPSLNRLPEVRIPVRKNPDWLSEDLQGAAMAVYLDGQRQPIDELREVVDRPGGDVLVGIGGIELRETVAKEYRDEQRYVAAKNLITNETSYNEDVDTPNFTVLSDQDQQDLSSTSEFQNNTSFVDTDPLRISGGDVFVAQTCFTQEAEDYDRGDLSVTTGQDDLSDGEGIVISDSVGTNAEWDFTLNHAIPDGEFKLYIRVDSQTNNPSVADFSLDGSQVGQAAPGSVTEWQQIVGTGTGSDPGKVTSGSHTIRVDSIGSGDNWNLDVVAPLDGRYTYSFDNTLNQNQGWLDGPQLYPQVVNAVGDDVTTPFSFIASDVTITIDDSGDNQYLQVSNDRGSTWTPTNGDEDNTTSIDVSFGSSGSTLRWRVGLSRYSPSGTRNQTPREGYDTQRLQSVDMDADVQQEVLLIDQRYRQDIREILTDIAGEDYLWSYNLDSNGNGQVSWTQPGQRTADDDPDIGDFEFTKDLDVFEKVTIEGSNRRITEESFQASSSFVALDNDDLVPGEESVYDGSGTTFERGTDYEMDYTNGEIKALDGGSLTDGNSYSIDYSVDISGSYTVSGAPADPREFTDEVPGVVTDRNAEQIAFTLATDFDTPRYAGTLTIPRAEATFDPLEALSLDNLDLPAAATPLEIRGQPEITPSGIRLRLGSRGRLERALDQIRQRVQSVSKRA